MTNAPALSDEERSHWHENGFLLVRNCLSDDEVTRLTESLAELAEASMKWPEQQRVDHLSTAGNGKHLDIVGLPFLTDSTDFLMDHRNIFGKILSLMGPFIYMPGMEYLERYSHDGPLLRLHTDGGGSLRCIFPSPESLVLQLKVQYFLTDTCNSESGNFMLVPASHRKAFPLDSEEIERAAQSAVPVRARKGDALVFPWSLWHCVAPNRSPQTRKSVIVRYAQLWMRPVEYDHLPDQVCARLSPRRQRLQARLPECRKQSDYYRPNLDLQISQMFGDEWPDHPDYGRYVNMKKPLKQLFDQ
jgi:ectoine hydroxylase-related dioxygenase (phytanoyl-CoA dioxygenase family)